MSFCLAAVLCKMDHRIWSSYIYSYDPLRQELKHIRGTSCYRQQYTSSATREISVACCGTEEICVPIDEVPSGASHGNLGTKLKSKMARKHYVFRFLIWVFWGQIPSSFCMNVQNYSSKVTGKDAVYVDKCKYTQRRQMKLRSFRPKGNSPGTRSL